MEPSFQSEFLRDFQGTDSGPVLALFGKHPAWDDHMDDLGLATPSLRMCKRLLYVQGMAANAARQRSLGNEEAAALQPYRHFLLWFLGREMILLRLAESQDGRGRGYFPLIAAIHFSTSSPEFALAGLLVPLATFLDACGPLRTRQEVGDLHRHTEVHFQSATRHEQSDHASVGYPTMEESDAMQKVAPGGKFVRAGIPITRYDLPKSFGALIAAAPHLPLLLALHDGGLEITVCAGQPEKDDFWFLREQNGNAR